MQNTEHGVSKGRRKYQRTLKKKKRFLTGLSNVSLSSDERYGWSVVLVKKKNWIVFKHCCVEMGERTEFLKVSIIIESCFFWVKWS